MNKNKYIKNIIFLIFFITVVFALISGSSAATSDAKEKIDSGKKILTVKNEKYQITWVTEKVIGVKEIYVDISYKSLKNKKKQGSFDITLFKKGKKEINIETRLPSLVFPNYVMIYKSINTKFSTDKYYWKKIRPQISKFSKNPILNKETLRYKETSYFNKTITDPAKNETLIKQYKIKWKVYYFNKVSSIEISKEYVELDNNGQPHIIFSGQNIYIDKYYKGRLIITTAPSFLPVCGSVSIDTKYVKTNLSPNQYYLKVFKKKLETGKIS